MSARDLGYEAATGPPDVQDERVIAVVRDPAYEGFSAVAPGSTDFPAELGRIPTHLSEDVTARPLSVMRSISRRSTVVVLTGEEARELAGPAPDGGLQAWLCVASCFLIQFCVFGIMSANGSLQAYYLLNQLKGHSKSDVAWFGSIQTLIEFSMGMFVGRYFDIHGPLVPIAVSVVLSAVAIVGLSLSHEYYQFLLSFILFGSAAAMIYTPSLAILSHWFDKKRGLAVGMVVCGAGIGGVLYPIIFERGFATIGYRNTMLLILGLNTALMLPGAFFMKSRLPPYRPPPWSDMKRPWRQVRYTFHVAGAAIFGMNILAPYFAANDYAVANNVPSHLVGYSVTFLMVGSIVGRILLGGLADIIGVWTVFGAVGFVSAIFMFALWLPYVGYGATIAGLMLYGAISGGWFALVPAATAVISPVHEAGMRFGMLISALAIPSLIGPVITSTLITKGNNTFKWAAVWCGCCFFISGLVVNAPPAWEWIRSRRAGPGQQSKECCDSVPLPADSSFVDGNVGVCASPDEKLRPPEEK